MLLEKGKEQLKDLSILTICEKCIDVLTEDKRKLSNQPKTLALYSQLQVKFCTKVIFLYNTNYLGFFVFFVS